MTRHGADFPIYTEAERAADRVLHLLGTPVAIVSVGWLLARFGPGATCKQMATLLLYGAGLIGTLSASAAYHLAPPGRTKALLQRLDHAMIFVMIAGSYSPFALNALGPRLGVALFVVVWALAAVGVGLKLAYPPGFELPSLALYLGMGWLVLGVVRSLLAVVPGPALLLLLLGGIVYSLGALVHAWRRLPFQNVIWHAMVLVGAGLHLAAVSRLFAWARAGGPVG